MDSKAKEAFCKHVIDVLREHKDCVLRPVLITQEMMDALQWKLRQSVKVQVEGIDISCVADDAAPASFTDAVADACKPEVSWQERAERAEAELARWASNQDPGPNSEPDLYVPPQAYGLSKRKAH